MKKSDKILLEIYQELYENSTPKADFKQLMEDGTTSKDGFFMDYYLDDVTQDKIVNKILDKHKIKNPYKRRSYTVTVLLGCSPTSSIKILEKSNEK